ncbi:hypothetical protein HDU77_010908 [Chytriomyces hyalinus]|nr:hypothetical protein HDU77_010908 [Chytriomyces hyalinus]
MPGNSKKPNASHSTNDCTPVPHGSICNEIDDASECKDKLEFIPVLSPQYHNTESSIEIYNDEVMECPALDFLNVFFRSQVKSADMTLASGKTIEAIFKLISLHNHGDAKERAAHSWIFSVDDPFSMVAFSEEDQTEIQQIWSQCQLSVKYFTGTGWSSLNEDYTKCKLELDQVEQMVKQGSCCQKVYKSILSLPIILCTGEELEELPIVIGLRQALGQIFEFWAKGLSVDNEAEYFRNLWDRIFRIHPEGIQTAATETTMRASKSQKLNTEDRANVRGLQLDISWQSETGVMLCWGEGKPGNSTDNQQ